MILIVIEFEWDGIRETDRWSYGPYIRNHEIKLLHTSANIFAIEPYSKEGQLSQNDQTNW